jgi:hypothetical protein
MSHQNPCHLLFVVPILFLQQTMLGQDTTDHLSLPTAPSAICTLGQLREHHLLYKYNMQAEQFLVVEPETVSERLESCQITQDLHYI